METGLTMRHKTEVYLDALASELEREESWLADQGDAEEDDSGWRRQSTRYIASLREAMEAVRVVEYVGFAAPRGAES